MKKVYYKINEKPKRVISRLVGKKITGIDHSSRWFEVNASHLGARHFDKKYGRGKAGYKKDSPDYFDIDSFRNSYYSPYTNPRIGKDPYGNNPQKKKYSTSKYRLSWMDFIWF